MDTSVPTDSLKLLYLLTFGVMRLRFVKFILITIFIFHATIGIVQIIDLLITFDGEQLLQYGPCFLVSCSCLVNIGAALSAEKLLSKIFIKLALPRFWTLNRLAQNITNKIKKESKIMTAVAIGDLSFLLLFTSIHLPLFGDKSVIYGLMLIDKSFDKMANFFCLVYYITLPILAYVAFINGGVVIYTLMHLRFYVFIINNNLEHIYEVIVDDYSKLRDAGYQNQVFEQLKVCVGRHQIVKMIEKKLNEELLRSFTLLLYLSIASVISMLLNILADDSKFGLFLAVTSMCVASITPTLVLHVGQILKNECDRLYENALRFPWIIWDSRNRQLLLIFLQSLQKSFLLGKPGLFLCEYSLIPKVLSFLWTVSTFILEVGYRK